MRLAAPGADIPDLDRLTAEVFDQRLLGASQRPVAVAFSGGGDSLALLLTAAAWTRRLGRRLLVLSVDHRLQPQSGAWMAACAARAAALGADFQALVWHAAKPAHGLPAAARAARHRLVAEAARAAGARVILIGHTADDILEARAMREAGASTPEPHAWTPSPAWPEGRGLFLLRPLLGVRRGEIRRWLEARGESWIEDPANRDLRFARPRARLAIGETTEPAPGRPAPAAPALAESCRMGWAGELTLARERLAGATPEAAALLVSAACLSAAGTSRPPGRARLDTLIARLTGGETFVAALAGARIEADAREIRFLREPGEFTRRRLPPLALTAGETAVWDGRFEITAPSALEIKPLAGLAARLGKREREALRSLPAKARAALPVGMTPAGEIAWLTPDLARPLALQRLLAACGAVAREPA